MSVPEWQKLMAEDLKRKLEKLSRQYDLDTMKVFIVVEALGESSLHAVYSAQSKPDWQSFLQRQEACRLDLAKHEKTREHYHLFLNEVRREDQGRQWFQAILHLMHQMGAVDVFNYISSHISNAPTLTVNRHHNHSPRRYVTLCQQQHTTNRHRDTNDNLHRYHTHYHTEDLISGNKGIVLIPSTPTLGIAGGEGFCIHLAKLFEKKLEIWFDSFQAVAVRLTAHVKVSGLVRVLSGQVNALCSRKGRLHALAIKVTVQDTPRPLDVAELCLVKILVIQNGLVLPEDLSLALLTLHVHPERPVLRLWLLTPSIEMETAIRRADIDDVIDAGRLSQRHELWADNATLDLTPCGVDNHNTDNDKTPASLVL